MLRAGRALTRTVIAGEGGSVLALAATTQADALVCEGLAAAVQLPSGVWAHPPSALPSLDVDRVLLFPCEPQTRAAVEALGVEIVGAASPLIETSARTVSVSAAHTASGKTAVSRRVARTLARSGKRVAVARHPMANLLLWDRFDAHVIRTPDELRAPRPLEEREELAPLIGAHVPVAVGLDPARVLQAAAREGDIIVWDGGGAAEPWVDAMLKIFVVDLLRDVDPERVARADVIVLTKADTAAPERAREIEAAVREANPSATLIVGDLAITVVPGAELKDRRAVVVEDWSTLVLGGFSAGAGAIAAKRFRCGVVDPRPFAVGAIGRTLTENQHIGAVIPSLGRTADEIADLAASVHATPGDVVLWASNADPTTVIPDERRPIVRAYGELTEVAGASLQEVLTPLM